MGRPIKDKFFGSSTTPYQNSNTGGRTGVGGEYISSILVTNTASNSGYSTTTAVTWVASAPQITGGIAASGTAEVSYVGGTGRIQTLTVVNSGTGYTTTGSLALTYSPTSAGTAATFVATTSTAARLDAISIISYLTTGSNSVSGGDIMKQEGSRRYLVQNSQGQGICKLSTGTLVAGQMHIIATDYAGDTYWVTKLTARKANLYPRSNTGTSIYSTVRVAPWTIGNSTGTTTGTAIVSLAHTV
jgi:hypothetical protein